MSTRSSLLKRFYELIDYGKSIPRYKIDSSLDNLAKKQKWETGCLHLLDRTFGNQSEYFKSFSKAITLGNIHAHFTHGLAIMEGAKEEVEKGFLYKIEHLISIDFFDSIIEQAKYLLDMGFKDPAAILGRVIIENSIKDIARRENINFTDKIKPSKLNENLWKKKVYAKNVWRMIQAQIDLGNYAAHGSFNKYDEDSVRNMLSWISDVLFTL